MYNIMVQAVAVMAMLRWMTQAANEMCTTTSENAPGMWKLERTPHYAESSQQWRKLTYRDISSQKALERCMQSCIEEVDQGIAIECLAFNLYSYGTMDINCELSRMNSLVTPKFGTHYFQKMCLPKSLVQSCQNKSIVFERLIDIRIDRTGIKPGSYREENVRVDSKEECEVKCLSNYQHSFVCRSAEFNRANFECTLMDRVFSDEELIGSSQHEYIENLCLTNDALCKDTDAKFILEENKSPNGYEILSEVSVASLEKCREACLNSRTLNCKAIFYKDSNKECLLTSDVEMLFLDGFDQSLKDGDYNYYKMSCHLGLFSNGIGTSALYDRKSGEMFFQKIGGHRMRESRRIARTEELSGMMSSTDCLSECLQSDRYGHDMSCTNVEYSATSRRCTLIELRDADRSESSLVPDRNVDFYRMVDRETSRTCPFVNTGPCIEACATDRDCYPQKCCSNGCGHVCVGDRYDLGSSGSGGLYNNYYPNRDRPIDNRYVDRNEVDPPRRFYCRDYKSFDITGSGYRLRSPYIIKWLDVPNQRECQYECERLHNCRSFSFRLIGNEAMENCQLSDQVPRDPVDPNNRDYFERSANYDYYTCFEGPPPDGQFGDLDVSQSCTPNEIEFTLQTPEGFYGRIYTYGFSDRCFTQGTGSSVTVLRIRVGRMGYPECGTARRGDDFFGNIVVVQFHDYVQTSRDRKYNLTCSLYGPGKTTVKSDQIVMGQGVPIPIYKLPAYNMLDNRVKLTILYRGRDTTSVVIGDPLTLLIENQQYTDMPMDIFATNLISKDPITGRIVQLLDSRGCPIDESLFPALDKSPDGRGLEAMFQAFAFPQSDYLVFQADVRSCRDFCEPVNCNAGGREIPSHGRKKREADSKGNTTAQGAEDEDMEIVNTMFRVYLSHEDMPIEGGRFVLPSDVCLTKSEFYGIVSAALLFFLLFVSAAISTVIYYRRWGKVSSKLCGISSSSSTGLTSSLNSTPFPTVYSNNTYVKAPQLNKKKKSLPLDKVFNLARCPGKWEPDPSEPIYTEPSLFEHNLKEPADQDQSSKISHIC